tara:strand:+ start:923 stop:2335 length:1413 start_codon:yes stop_codon:yes gene_type:complete
MIKKNNSQHLNAGVMAIILLSLMYSFGTFGFLNLFGARSIVQMALIAVMTSLFIVMRFSIRVSHLFPIIVFSGTYVIGSLIFSGTIASLVDMYILIFCFVLFFYAPPKHLIFFSKVLVIATTILCILVVIAFIYYQIYPVEVSRANIFIYSSEVGSKRIYPGHFMDFISFTSGEGFNINGHQVTRMKGYSNEPSSTIVHYVAPAAIAFILGGRFLYLGVFILAVNIVAIASFTSYIILILSFAFFTIKFIPKVIGKALFFLTICCFLFFVFNPDIVLSGFRYVSLKMLDYAGFDLLSRKIGDGSVNSNLGDRHQGIIEGFKLALTSPLGYPKENLGSGAGLFFMVSSRAGWIGILIFGVFMAHFIKNIKITYFMASSSIYVYGLSLLLSTLLVALFISGYGWSRPPGIIMILLFFRFLQIVASENNALPNFMNRRFVSNSPRKDLRTANDGDFAQLLPTAKITTASDQNL